MSKENFLNKVKYLPETTKQFGGLVLIILIISLSFFVLNIMFGGGDELVRKMKLEEERIAKEIFFHNNILHKIYQKKIRLFCHV